MRPDLAHRSIGEPVEESVVVIVDDRAAAVGAVMQSDFSHSLVSRRRRRKERWTAWPSATGLRVAAVDLGWLVRLVRHQESEFALVGPGEEVHLERSTPALESERVAVLVLPFRQGDLSHVGIRRQVEAVGEQCGGVRDAGEVLLQQDADPVVVPKRLLAMVAARRLGDATGHLEGSSDCVIETLLVRTRDWSNDDAVDSGNETGRGCR